MFGLAGYGLYAVLWAAVNLLEKIFVLGMTSAMQRTVPQSASGADAAAALRTAMVFGVGPCILVAALVAVFAAELGPLLNVAAQDRDLVTPAIRIFVRSEEHTSELQSLMRNSYAVFCLKKKKQQ